MRAEQRDIWGEWHPVVSEAEVEAARSAMSEALDRWEVAEEVGPAEACERAKADTLSAARRLSDMGQIDWIVWRDA